MPSLKDRDTNASVDSVAASLAADSSIQKPVALEVPITVNGARPLEGNDKREPFSESTKTVLVFGNGAVIRLGSTVAPGQLLFVTNERTKKEVVCQVVRAKSAKNRSGYVEVEFTESISGFWGMRFPADRASLRYTTPLSDSDSDTDQFLRSVLDTTAPVTQKLDDASSDSSVAPADVRPKAEPKSEERASSGASFLGDIRGAVEKLESNRLQERLAAWVSEEKQAPPTEGTLSPAEPAARKALSDFGVKPSQLTEVRPVTRKEPTPASVSQLPKAPSPSVSPTGDIKSASPTEELKLPTWLEPLTKDTSASAAGVQPPAMTKSDSGAAELKAVASEKESQRFDKSKAVKATPVVGIGLLGRGPASAASQHSSKGLVIGIAAGLLIAAGGATWYFNQPAGPALTNKSDRASQVPAAAAPPTAEQSPATAPTTGPTTASSQQEQALDGPADTTVRVVATPLPAPSKSAPNFVPENTSASAASRPAQQPAVVTERIPKTSSTPNSAGAASSAVSSADSVESESKKLSLDNAPPAKPKIKRRNQSASVSAPALSETTTPNVAPDASLGAGLVPNVAAQPAAPAPAAPVGGEVKPARLVSQVPPVYPPIAKSQHVAGDVRIDALIDANGRVSSMKAISGPPMLHQAAMDALRQWKYEPATLNGTAVPMHLTVTIQFHLQ
jgi:TonB family protein